MTEHNCHIGNKWYLKDGTKYMVIDSVEDAKKYEEIKKEKQNEKRKLHQTAKTIIRGKNAGTDCRTCSRNVSNSPK